MLTTEAVVGNRAIARASIRPRVAAVRGHATTKKSAVGKTSSSCSMGSTRIMGLGLPLRVTAVTRSPMFRAASATAPPNPPSPSTTTCFPLIKPVSFRSHLHSRWACANRGNPACSAGKAHVMYSRAFSACTPLLFVKTAPEGSQSRGRYRSMPALVECTNFSRRACVASRR